MWLAILETELKYVMKFTMLLTLELKNLCSHSYLQVALSLSSYTNIIFSSSLIVELVGGNAIYLPWVEFFIFNNVLSAEES